LESVFAHWISQYGYAGIFSLLMFGIIGLPVPDETLLTFSGYLVFKGELGIIPTIASAFLGSICGISISYGVGRSGGMFLIRKYGSRVRITPEDMERAGRWMGRFGRWALLFGYFIPGVRHLTALAAGASQIEYPVFAVFAYAGGLVWSTTFIALGYFLGKEWVGTSAAIHRWALIASSAIVLILLAYYLANRKTPKNNRPNRPAK
jgi:membrane protein DedA with SNARE-associated domain